jgi:DNA-binding NarL/FixJ family response regulator
MKIRVALVEDQKKTREGLFFLLKNAMGIEVVGMFSTGEEAIDEIPKLKPDVVLIDLGLPGISGMEVIKRLKEHFPKMEMLVLTVYEDRKHLFSALKAGASGYLLKDSRPEEIVKAVREICSGSSPMSPKVARYVIEFFHGMRRKDGTEILTKREREILSGIADGLTSKKLAERLYISPHTVRTHIKKIYDKLHVHSKVEAVMKAKEKGIL